MIRRSAHVQHLWQNIPTKQALVSFHKMLNCFFPFRFCSDYILTEIELRCLDQHYMTHLATRQLPCPLCGKTFARKSFLAKHVGSCGGVKQEVET